MYSHMTTRMTEMTKKHRTLLHGKRGPALGRLLLDKENCDDVENIENIKSGSQQPHLGDEPQGMARVGNGDFNRPRKIMRQRSSISLPAFMTCIRKKAPGMTSEDKGQFQIGIGILIFDDVVDHRARKTMKVGVSELLLPPRKVGMDMLFRIAEEYSSTNSIEQSSSRYGAVKSKNGTVMLAAGRHDFRNRLGGVIPVIGDNDKISDTVFEARDDLNRSPKGGES